MPYRTNFYGWEFHVDTESREGRWLGVVRIVGDANAPETRVRCQVWRDSSAQALDDAKAHADDWSERLERRPQPARTEPGKPPVRDDDDPGLRSY